MESPDHDAVAASNSSSSSTGCAAPTAAAFLKRRRTKRPPLRPFAASSSTSSADAASAAATEEEEDMAHCLILLAQGHGLDLSSSPPPPPSPEKFTSRKFTETMTTAGGKAGFYVYECKTCNKCFPSFQALGGHRASHKKPKLTPPTIVGDHGNGNSLDVGASDVLSLKPAAAPAAANSPAGSNKMRVHECSICGAEFSSGQALGGHMRRHRPIGAPLEQQEVKKERNVLSLDLNLPAPSDETPPIAPSPLTVFSFADKRPPMVFSATSAALVDCHY